MTRVKIKPAPGLKPRGPDLQQLPPEGKEVALSSFWIRRLACGDVVLVSADPSRAITAPMPAKEGEDE